MSADWTVLNLLTFEQFGAKGDGITDDAPAIKAAVAAAPAGSAFVLGPKVYNIKSHIQLTKRVAIYGNSSTIHLDAAFDVSSGTLEAFLVTADDVSFFGVIFDGTGAPTPTTNSRFVWTQNARTIVRGCSAMSLPSGAANVQVAFGASATSSEFTVQDSRGDSCPGFAFSQGPRPMVQNNRITNPKDISIALNSTNCVGGIVSGNSISNLTGSTVSGHILVEEGASQWIIINNNIFGVKNGTAIGAISITITTVVEGGIIAENIIDGGAFVSSNPSALINVTGYYQNTKIENNKMKSMPSGLASNAAIVCTTRGTMLRGNKIDAKTGSGSGGAIQISPGTGDFYLFDNDCDVTGGPGRHVLVLSGDNAGGKIHIKGGRFIGGVEGINMSLSVPTNTALWAENISEITSTNPFNVTGSIPAFGDRQAFFNSAGAAQFPHSIKAQTIMAGTGIPLSGTFTAGDRITRIQPVTAAPMDWYCTISGSPGTWRAGGNIA